MQQLKISAGDLADQGDHHATPGFVGGEILRARSLAGTPDAAPKINLPGSVEIQLGGSFGGAVEGGWRIIKRIATTPDIAAVTDLRKESAVGRCGLVAGLFHAGNGLLEIVVVRDRGADQVLQ